MEEVTTNKGCEEVVTYWWLSEFHIIVAFEESWLMEVHMIKLKIRVTSEFKEILNKFQPVNLKIKKKKRKYMMMWHWYGLIGA